MKLLGRIVIVVCTYLATYYLIYWVPFSFIALLVSVPLWLKSICSLSSALLVVWFFWQVMAEGIKNGRSAVIISAVSGESIGFDIGFFGPMLLSPGANQGLLLGFLIAGPAGLFFGVIGGGIYWSVPSRKRIEPHSSRAKEQ